MLRILAWLSFFVLLPQAVLAQTDDNAKRALEATKPATNEAMRLLNEAKRHITEDEYPEAIEVLNRMLAIRPGILEGYINRGLAHGAMGNYGEAISDFTHVVRRSDGAAIRSLRGNTYFRAGRFEESVRDLEESAALDPKGATSLDCLPLSLYYQGEFAKAAKQCALLHNPAKDNHHLVLIHFLCNLRLHGINVATEKALTLPIGTTGDVPLLLQVFQERITADQMLDQLAAQLRVAKEALAYGGPFTQYFIGLWHEAHGRDVETRTAIAHAFKSRLRDRTSRIYEAISVHHWLLQDPRPPYPPRHFHKAIVYVVDISGSTVGVLPFMHQEMKRSINGLAKEHLFSVLFFQNNQCIEAVSPGFKSGTSDSKAQVFKWIELEAGNIQPGGSSDPRKALQRAFDLNPDLIFLLSDNLTGQGRIELNQKKLCADIITMNTERRRINTIQFLHIDPVDGVAGMKSTLHQISLDSNGVHKFVAPKDYGLEK